jgi:hypothetical protein
LLRRRAHHHELRIGQFCHGSYLPFSQPGGQLLFHLISKLYENTSLLITNVSVAPATLSISPTR